MSVPERPELRISDTEREAAVASLGEHYAAGRLTKDEYDERAAAAFGARTASVLRPLFTDLPAPHPFAAGQTRAGATAGPRPGGRAGWAPTSGPGRPRPGFRLPVLPILLVLVGLAILLNAPWLVFLGLGAMWFAKAHRRSGSWAGGCGSAYRHHGSSR